MVGGLSAFLNVGSSRDESAPSDVRVLVEVLVVDVGLRATVCNVDLGWACEDRALQERGVTVEITAVDHLYLLI